MMKQIISICITIVLSCERALVDITGEVWLSGTCPHCNLCWEQLPSDLDCCQDGYYLQSIDWNQCDKYWSTCAIECLSCSDGTYVNSSGSCQPCAQSWNTCNENGCLSCPDGTYVHSGGSCQPCAQSWKTCHGPNDIDWLSWDDEVLTNGECRCQDGKYDTNPGPTVVWSGECHQKCRTCVGPDDNQWLSCVDGRYFYEDLGICPDSWPEPGLGDRYQDGDYCRWSDVNWYGCDENGCTSTICAAGQFQDPSDDSQCIDSCPEGYFANGTACEPCIAWWQAWVNLANECTTCKAANTELVDGATVDNCMCAQGWFDSDPSDEMQCEPWNATCESWSGGSTTDCLTCLDGFYLQPEPEPNTCGQLCPTGYFGNSQNRHCQAWHYLCATCSDADAKSCVTCHENAILENQEWICSDGSFSNPDSANCTAWHTSCATWSSEHDIAWLSWHDTGYNAEEGNWVYCGKRYYYDIIKGQCEICHSECALCSEHPACLQCVDIYKTPDAAGICQYETCEPGNYRDQIIWKPWNVLWITCTSQEIWQSWVLNASLSDTNQCQCNDGFTESSSGCKSSGDTPTWTLEQTSVNTLLLKFNEPMSGGITEDDIESVEISGPREGGYQYTWAMTEIQAAQEYEIELTFEHDDIPEGTTVSVNLAGYVQNKDANSQQITIDLSGEVTQDSSSTDANTNSIGENATSVNQVALIASIASGSVTGDFSGLWNMINTLMILAFIPLMPNSLPQDVVNVMKSFLDFDILPNFFEYALENFAESGPEPYSNAKDFGYDHSVFLINGGDVLSQILGGLCILPLALLLSQWKITITARYFANIAANYKWSFFIRAWIEIYLELAVATFLQLLASSDDNPVLLINSIAGYIFGISILLTPLIVTIALLKAYDKITKPTPLFSKRYGSLFIEFKNEKGKMSVLYYALFFWRRILYIINIIFMRDYKLPQFIINLLLCTISLLYLLKYRPYTERIANVLAIYSESATLAVFIFSYSFWYTNDDQDDSMQWVTISIIFTIMIFYWLNIIRQQLSAYRDMWQKWRRGRTQRNAENTNDVVKVNKTQSTVIQETESELPSNDNSKRMVFPDSSRVVPAVARITPTDAVVSEYVKSIKRS